jgi:hypothetical protein
MAKLVKKALRKLPEKAAPEESIQAVPISAGLLARQVVSREAQRLLQGNPAPLPATDVAPDYFILYEPLSWVERRRHKARCLVVRILSANDAAAQYSIPVEL